MTEKVEVNQLLGMQQGEQAPTQIPEQTPVETPEQAPAEKVEAVPTTKEEPAEKQEEVVEEKVEEKDEKEEEEIPQEEVKVSEEEVKEVEVEEKKEEEKQKEEVKEDIKDKSEEYIESVIENLLEDTTKLRIDSRVIEKERDVFKEKREEASKELNSLKYDSKRIAVRDEYRPLLKVMEEHAQDPKDNNSEMRVLTMLYEQIAWITWADYRAEINDFYQRKAQNISKLSWTNTWVSSVPSVVGKKWPKATWVVRQSGTRKRF
jgi:hypothetical protein